MSSMSESSSSFGSEWQSEWDAMETRRKEMQAQRSEFDLEFKQVSERIAQQSREINSRINDVFGSSSLEEVGDLGGISANTDAFSDDFTFNGEEGGFAQGPSTVEPLDSSIGSLDLGLGSGSDLGGGASTLDTGSLNL